MPIFQQTTVSTSNGSNYGSLHCNHMARKLFQLDRVEEGLDILSELSCNNKLSCRLAIPLPNSKTLHCNRKGKMLSLLAQEVARWVLVVAQWALGVAQWALGVAAA